MSEGKNITIKDIAREAGVSVATVSRVINSKEVVDKNTRKKVLKIIHKYNYFPNFYARALVSKSKNSIGLIFPYNENMLSDLYLTEITYFIEKEVIKRGYDFSLFFSHYNTIEDIENQYLNLFNSGKIQALIIGGVQLRDESVKPLIKDNYPFVLIGSYLGYLKYNYVDVDHRKAVKNTVLYFLEKQKRKIYYFGSSPLFSSAVDKINGFKDAMAEYNLKGVDKYIFLNISWYDEAFNLVTNLIKENNLPEVIFCDHDMSALGALNALLRNNIKVPEEISVVGYNDIKIDRFIYPSLSTIKLPIDEIAKNAVTMLIKLIEGKRKKLKGKILEGKFIKRESSI